MSCGSPCGTFTSLSAAELAVVKAAALARVNSGSRTSLSGGAKSGSKEWVDPMDILREVKYAEQQLGLIAPRVTKTYFDSAYPPSPVVAGEQV